ncbi:TIMELESS-interacting protein [Rhodamnia argentea]|uniref:TIMELESS-interacting protein n=1 Tax=Rhodamnia argentea TaxID=178133 RepID=A0A8B8NPS5_9MYRT|nr:TIMELESS-interacting protein [Rhodamnia argentea]
METAGKSVPTGCYKCGLPGHWSRDCPSDPIQNSNSNSNPNPRPSLPPSSSIPHPSGAARATSFEDKPAKPKKVPMKRPKLTPELLLSDDGLGYVLRHFPRNFKYRGRGNEVSDLGNLIGMYREWHSHLIPYYSFDQFVRKVEQVAASKQVKRCIGELRERVASGRDLTKLHESPSPEEDGVNNDQGLSTPFEPTDTEETRQHARESSNNTNADDLPQDILHEIYEKALEDAPRSTQGHDVLDLVNASQNQVTNTVTSKHTKSQISDEQKARMELNRLKALEKAAARSRSQQGS